MKLLTHWGLLLPWHEPTVKVDLFTDVFSRPLTESMASEYRVSEADQL